MKHILILRLAWHFLSQTANFGRRSMIDVVDSGVESAHRTKACGEGDLGHGQGSLVDKFLGKVQTARLRDGAGRGSEVTQKKTSKMARANSEMFRQGSYAALFQTGLAD